MQADQQTVMAVRDLKKHFPIKEGALQRVAGHVQAVDGVSFDLVRGETLGLVGESGCGKTTLGRVLAGLTPATSGGIFFDLSAQQRTELDAALVAGSTATDVASKHRVDQLTGDEWRRFRRNTQMVFQDSFSSLNPRHLVSDIVGRPLRVYKEASGSALIERTVELLEQVGLGRQHLYRYPHQFSGGQRQRISIARALALDPELVILDEPTSALDVSVQAQILNLLHDLQQQRALTFLFITHDLSVVRHMADRIAVMYLGRIVESGTTSEIFSKPQHPYTDALLRANPDLAQDDDGFQGLEGTVPDPARPPQGCRFHTRCVYATVQCGWEIDDVVLQLEDTPALFDKLEGVERRSAFDADLQFEDASAANSLRKALDSGLPPGMAEALESVSVQGQSVSIRFRETEEVMLVDRGHGRQVACVLDEVPAR